jgi:hypothetical protein
VDGRLCVVLESIQTKRGATQRVGLGWGPKPFFKETSVATRFVEATQQFARRGVSRRRASAEAGNEMLPRAYAPAQGYRRNDGAELPIRSFAIVISCMLVVPS